ncbi:hypothetical protein K4H02_21935, partial [Mycobacterium tuberculosis]|nr:hypothetical protein [Mycobacterium tuberculosis]
VLKRVAGRARDLFRFADGHSVWPFVPFVEVRRFIEMRQMQVVQTARDRIELHYVPEGAGRIDQAGAAAVVRTVERRCGRTAPGRCAGNRRDGRGG